MTTNPTPAAVEAKPSELTVKMFGIGNAGVTVLEQMLADELPCARYAAIDSDAASLARSSIQEKLLLETRLLRGLGSGGDPERGRAAAEERFAELKAACQGCDAVFIVAGLGGGAGTGIAPVLARAATESGALAVGFVAMPFECEGPRRQRLAEYGLQTLKENADAVVCLPNEKIFTLIDENSTVRESFRFAGELLADGVRALWRLLTLKGHIEIHFSDLCDVIRGQHTDSAFAVAEAMGAARSREVCDKLLAHPLLEGGRVLKDAQSVIISLIGGQEMTMAEVRYVMQHLGSECERAQVIMGAALDERFRDRLLVTVIAARKRSATAPAGAAEEPVRDEFDRQLLSAENGPRPGARIVPPPPDLPPEQARQLLERQPSNGRGRKAAARYRQAQLPLQIVSKGRFDKSEPTIHRGEDLDVPTYIRRGISLN